MDEIMKLKIAVPSKGRISDPAVRILEKAGLRLKDSTNRKLFSQTYNEDIDVMFARAADIPEFVDEGICDMGITDMNNMGAAMAPAAALTLKRYFDDTKTKPKDYDLIVTGDLGTQGKELLRILLKKDGIKDHSRLAGHTNGGNRIGINNRNHLGVYKSNETYENAFKHRRPRNFKKLSKCAFSVWKLAQNFFFS